jgi:hypothetical protein
VRSEGRVHARVRPPVAGHPVTAGPGPADAPAVCATDAAGAASALEHARRFVAHLPAYSIDDWREVLPRVHAVDAAAHGAALRRAAPLLAAHADAEPIDALQRAALTTAPTEAAGPGTGAACGLAGRVGGRAAGALALRDALTPGAFAALYAPFARPSTVARAARADRGTAVPALRTVAAPLASRAPRDAAGPAVDPGDDLTKRGALRLARRGTHEARQASGGAATSRIASTTACSGVAHRATRDVPCPGRSPTPLWAPRPRSLRAVRASI